MSDGIDILKNALNESNKTHSEIPDTQENKEEAKEASEVAVGSGNETGPVVDKPNTGHAADKTTPKDTGHSEFKKGLSIFSDLKKTTEEDKDIKEAKSVVENLAEKASGGLDLDSEGEKMAYKMKAEIYIDVIDWLATMGLCALTADFSDPNKAKFSLHKDRRKVIADRWAQYMILSKAKVNPRNDLIVFIAGSYIPLFGVALMIWNQRRLDKKKPAAQVSQNQVAYPYRQHQQQQSAYQATYQQEQQQHNHNPSGPIFTPNESSYLGPNGEEMVKKRGVQPGVKRGPYKK
jgi:hypothetical protein